MRPVKETCIEKESYTRDLNKRKEGKKPEMIGTGKSDGLSVGKI